MAGRGEGADFESFDTRRRRFLIAAAVEVWITIDPNAKLSHISDHPLQKGRLRWVGDWNVTALSVLISWLPIYEQAVVQCALLS